MPSPEITGYGNNVPPMQKHDSALLCEIGANFMDAAGLPPTSRAAEAKQLPWRVGKILPDRVSSSTFRSAASIDLIPPLNGRKLPIAGD